MATDGKPMVFLTLHPADAERLDNGLSDILCWVQGFLAARPDDPNGPLGHEQVRDLRLKLQRAIREAKGER